ncbi:hypothetical protein AAMO2058_001702300 [Amorphochlora amoebiformis]
MDSKAFAEKFPDAAKKARTASELLEAAKKQDGGAESKAKKAIICPSILSADFARLASECSRMVDLGADFLHVDVMDGHFVPNLTIGAPVVKSLRKHTKSVLDCHLMVSNPEQWIPDFNKAGADTFCFHLEAVSDPLKVIKAIKQNGMKPGIALKPDTPVSKVFPYCEHLHHVLVMTVEPGFGGQKFMWWTMPKVAGICARFPSVNIQVDGGVKTHTIHACSKAGANMIVSGSGIFGVEDPGKAMEIMKTSVCSQGAA